MLYLDSSTRSRLIVAGKLASIHLDLIDDRRDFFSPAAAILRAVAILGSLGASTCWEEQRFQGRDAAADDADVGLDGGPDPDLVALPGCVVGFEEGVVDPVGSERASDDDDTSDAE